MIHFKHHLTKKLKRKLNSKTDKNPYIYNLSLKMAKSKA